VLNKVDMLSGVEAHVKKFVKEFGWKGRVFAISAISGIGCKELTYAMMEHLESLKAKASADEAAKQSKEPELNHELPAT